VSDVTQIIETVAAGDPHAADQLLPIVYNELRRLAGQRLGQEPPGQTLQPTALVHEAYLRLVDVKEPQQWRNRGHFFAAAAEAMRRILVEQARRKASLKHGGGWQRVEMGDVAGEANAQSLDLLALDDALKQLAAKDPRKAELVKLRFFAGLTIPQAAEAIGISSTTADNDWAYAKSWLRVQMADAEPAAVQL
jgi:RNA polymerase sigma factor (TIGR02999 family)